LSETPKAPEATFWAVRRGTKEVGHKRGKRAEKKGMKHRTKAREHQVNCLTQKVEDKGRKGGNEGSPLLPLVWHSQRRGLGFIGRERARVRQVIVPLKYAS
jgi:hypothetical protein